ncbi:MAG: ABC transporter ATP-binding protein [Flavobacteriaceae bacterium]|jgi:iron complex transport system ATP-binding protein|nr:ABC transporter ATP-binding protein [Flavobacteriaceae bacterium]
MEENNKILYTENLSIGYITQKRKTCVADNLNLFFETATLVGLVGSNGIGKSTLLRTLTGIQKPLSGQVMLQDRNINNYPPKELAKQIGVVLTEKLPPSNLSVFELIALGRQPYTNWIGKMSDEDIDKTHKAIELTQTEDLMHKKYYELSDGQLQKVLIARALAQDTPLIVLDEPTTHLDLKHKVGVLKLLKKLAVETQKCILFSSHDIDLTIQLSNRMIVMTTDGVWQNTPTKLIEQGVFSTLFKDEKIHFDAETGRFKVES